MGRPSKTKRAANWERRHTDIATIEQAGFKAEALDGAGHHFRIRLKGEAGFVDFWPSTWRWRHGRNGVSESVIADHGLPSMLAYLADFA